MFNRFDIWKFKDDANCWDFVREFLLENTDIPEFDLPRYGIHPNSKKEMTAASRAVNSTFIECGPIQFAIACHFVKNTLFHVGVVDCEKVRHTTRQLGTLKESVGSFERRSSITKYKIHRSLCQ